MRIKRIHEQKEERDKRTDGVKRVHNEKGGGEMEASSRVIHQLNDAGHH